MTDKTSNGAESRSAIDLRRRAEDRVRDSGPVSADSEELMYELRVHQEELTMQNEALHDAQEKLKAAHAKYLDLFDQAPIGYLVCDEHGYIQELNACAAQILNTPANLLRGTSFARFAAPNMEDIFYLHCREAISKNSLVTCQMKLLLADGKQREIELQSIVIDGDESQIRTSITEISQRKEVERERQALASIFRVAPVGIGLERARTIHEINEHLCGMTGYSREELVGKPTRILYASTEEYERVVQEMYGQILSSGAGMLETQWRQLDGSIIDVILGATPLDSKEVSAGTTFTALDITSSKQAQTILKRNEEMLCHAQSVGKIGAWEWDLANDKIFWSEETYRIHGSPAGSLESTQDHIDRGLGCYADEDRVRIEHVLQKCVEEGVPYEVECPFTTCDDRQLWIRTAGRAIREEGRTVKVVGDIQDITERKQAEEERSTMEKRINQAQRMESLGLVAGGIAHDFNNMLGSILGYVQLARVGADTDLEKAKERLSKAEAACMKAAELTSRLLTFSKGGAPTLQPVSLPALVTQSAEFVLHGTDVEGNISFPEDLWEVDADMGQLSQVVTNLVMNARQAMSSGGTIHISGENFTLSTKQVELLEAGRYVRLIVQDSGPGITSDIMPKIFEPYFTTKQEGSGLGLATCFSIIHRHGGTITVESELGQGCTFKVYLPASDGQTAPAPDPVQPTPRSGGRVLIMDDTLAIRMIVCEYLVDAGYDVAEAEEGETAIQLYSEAQKAGQPFDVVILDLTVPVGLGGLDTLKRLLELDPAVKAIVASGYASDDTIANYAKLGFRAALPKPFKLNELEALVEKVICSPNENP